jgi:hypothetical protein
MVTRIHIASAIVRARSRAADESLTHATREREAERAALLAAELAYSIARALEGVPVMEY